MTLDIRGSLKNTKVSSNKYIVVEEMISNAIDSFLLRHHQDNSVIDLQVTVSIHVFSPQLFNGDFDMAISCTDNGSGLGDEQTGAFITKDTSYKDDLPIAGIGKCKGSGRIQFFHHFERVGIRSTYREGVRTYTRTLPLVAGRKKIEAADFDVSEGDVNDISTTVTLEGLRAGLQERFYKLDTLADVFSAYNVRRYMLIAFVQRLVSLKAELGDFRISFETTLPKDEVERASLNASDLPPVTAVKKIKVEERNPQAGNLLGRQKEFTIFHYKLAAKCLDLPRNAISFCAKSSPVLDITRRYLRTQTEQNNPVGGFHHIILIEGELLDRCVNEQRDGFVGIPDEISGNLFADETISFAAIHEAIDPIITAMVVPSGWSKDDVIKDAATKFGVSPAMISDTETRVVYGDNAKSVAERVLRKYQDRVIAETAEIFDLKEEIARAEPHSVDFRRKIHDLSWKYTSSLKTFDMANLSQLVVRRAAIVEILSLACDRMLDVQADEVDKSLTLISCATSDSSDQQHGRGGVDEGGCRADGPLEVLREPSIAPEPGEAALDHPTSRVDGKTDLIGWLADNLDGDRGRVGDAVSGVCAIGEGALHEREAKTRSSQQRHSTVAILNRGWVDLHREQPSVGVDHRVALASEHLLSGIVAAKSACFGRLHTLAVDHDGRGTGVTSDALAIPHHEVVRDRLPDPVVPP